MGTCFFSYSELSDWRLEVLPLGVHLKVCSDENSPFITHRKGVAYV